MAAIVCVSNGNFTGAIWKTALSVGSQYTVSYSTTLGTSFAYSPSFAGDGSEVSGVVVYLMCYGTTASGYLYVVLRDATNSQDVRTVTVDLANFPARFEGWIYFHFDSPATLTSGVNYAIGLRTSNTYQVYACRDSTANNWARFLLGTTSPVSPAAGDAPNIIPHCSNSAPWTTFNVVMDNNTADAFSSLYVFGSTLSFRTDADTRLRVGTIWISTNGKILIGSAQSPLPSAYTAILEITCSSNGQNGIRIFKGGELSAYGYPLYPHTYALLNADVSAGATAMTVDRETGWKAGDEIAVAGTGTSLSEVELKTLAGNAVGANLSLSSALSYGHRGSNGMQAEVINLRRNVIIRSTTTYTTYIAAFGSGSDTVKLHWVRLDYLGTTSSDKYGITLGSTASNGALEVCHCALYSWAGSVVYEQSSTNLSGGILIQGNVAYNDAVGHMVYLFGSTPSVVVQDNCFMMNSSCSYPAINCSNPNAVVKNNRVANSPYESIKWNNATPPPQFQGNVVHTCSRHGFYFSVALNPGGVGDLISRNQAWHCALSTSSAYAGLYVTEANGVTFQGFDLWGNGQHASSSNLDLGDNWNCVLKDCRFGGSAAVASKRGVYLGRARTSWELQLVDCQIGQASGQYTGHSVADIDWTGGRCGAIRGVNTVLGSGVKVIGVPGGGSCVRLESQVLSGDRCGVWKQYGSTVPDSVYYQAGPYSARLTPNSAGNKYEGYRKLVLVAANNSATISVKVRKSSAAAGGANYNGNQPRLVLKANPVAGIESDQVLATMTAGLDTWETLSGTTPVMTVDAVLEVVVDCDGTAGFINVADMGAY